MLLPAPVPPVTRLWAQTRSSKGTSTDARQGVVPRRTLVPGRCLNPLNKRRAFWRWAWAEAADSCARYSEVCWANALAKQPIEQPVHSCSSSCRGEGGSFGCRSEKEAPFCGGSRLPALPLMVRYRYAARLAAAPVSTRSKGDI